MAATASASPQGDGAPVEVDVLVVGSGAGALTTAVTAAVHGLKVLAVEKEPRIGGSTARSGGWLWVPCNHLARRAGIDDDADRARAYLRALAGPHYDAARADAFIEHAPRMLEFMERNTQVRFVLGAGYPDYEGREPGALDQGRSMYTEPFDGRELGAALGTLEVPMREATFLGIALNTGPELQHFLNVTRSLTSAMFVARRLLSQLHDVLRYGRSTRLVSGNALAGRLLRSANERGVEIWRESPALELIVDGGRVAGALVRRGGTNVRVLARRGVVIATGGFSHDRALTASLFAHLRAGGSHASLVPAGNAGEGIRMARAAGAAMNDDVSSPAAWAPVSVFQRSDGSTGTYFHLIDRGKAGVIAVSPAGRRFVNESDSYHRFVLGMLAHCASGGEVFAWLLADHSALRRFGMGAVRPAPLPIAPFLRSGYLKRGDTIGALAREIGVDAAVLERTVAEFNEHAARGEDPAFGKGSLPYNRLVGDPLQRPNPCVRPLGPGPFYAVRLIPGDLGTFAGLRTDARARVLRADGSGPVPGLYAVGNDAASVGGGAYPGAGAMLAPAMAFGYAVALELAGAQAGGGAA